MAERFTGQRCQDCQGGLIYNKKEKYWECPYCGKIYERELRFNKVQIDGLAGINDLIRSTLSKLISLDFSGAEKDLLECEKIDHASVGTLIAKISVSIFKSFYTKDRQTELGKVNALLPKLNRDFQDIDEPEEILYDFIDSSDIYALLAVVYSMTGQTQRKEKIYDLLDCEEVYNPNVSKYLINILLKENRIGEADILLDNIASSNSRYGIMSVLNSYPSTEKKPIHVDHLLDKLDPEADVSKLFDEYFGTNQDDGAVVVDVFLSAVAHKVNFDTSKVIDSVLQNCTNIEIAQKTFNSMGAKRLDEVTAGVILDWTIHKCSDAAVSDIAFGSLFKGNSVFEITDAEISALFVSEQTDDIKCEKFLQLLNHFKISSKSLDRALSFHMLQNKGSREYRKKVFDELSERVASIPLTVIEQYVLNTDFDAEYKADFLKSSFAKVRTASIATGVFSQYLKTGIDSAAVREKVIAVFLDHQLVPDPDAMSYYLLNGAEIHSDDLLDLFIRRSCRTLSNTFDRYISNLSDPKSYNPKIADLSTKYGFVLGAIGFQKYLLKISETENKKIASTRKYLSVCANAVRDVKQTVCVADTNVTVNLAQAYFLTSEDDPYVMQEVINLLSHERIKVDIPLELTAERKKIKIKKFIETNGAKLSKKIETLAGQIL